MTKHSLKRLWLLLCLFTLSGGLSAWAETLDVCDGTADNSAAPIYGGWLDASTNKATSQVIYPASLLEEMSGGKIKSVTFYLKSSTTKVVKSVIDLSIGETTVTTTTAASYTDMTEIRNGLQKVYSATPFSESGLTELTFTFSEPYEYSGDNLIIDTYCSELAASGDKFLTTTFYGLNGYDSGVSVYAYNSSFYKQSFLPKATFEYEPGEKAAYAAKVSTEALDLGLALTGNTTTKTFTVRNTGANAITPVVGGLEAPFSLTADGDGELAPSTTRTYTVTYAPTAGGEHSGTITVSFGRESGLEDQEIAVSGKAIAIPTGYTEEFDGLSSSKVLPAGWSAVKLSSQNAGEYALADLDSYTNGISTTTAGALTFNNNPYLSTPFLLITPNVSGDLFFTIKGNGTSREFRAFPIVDGKIKFTTDDEIAISFTDETIGTLESSYATLHVDGEQPVAIWGKYVYLEFFAADAVSPVAASPTKITYNTILAGKTEVKQVTITNIGNEELPAPTASIAGEGFIAGETAAIPAGESKTIDVTFAPIAAGEHAATLTLDFGTYGTRQVALAGAAVAAPTGYQVTFDDITTDNLTSGSWIPAGWTVFNGSGSLYTTYNVPADNSINSSFKLNTTADATALEYSGSVGWLVSPKVKGKVLVTALATSYTPITTYFRVFKVADGKIQANTSGEYTITWTKTNVSGEWVYGSFEVNDEDGAQVAIRLYNAAIDLFAADEMIDTKELVITNVKDTPAEVVADENGVAHINATVTLRNKGTLDVAAEDYQFGVIEGYNNTEAFTTVDGTDIAVGETKDVTISFDYTATAPSATKYFYISETLSGTKYATSFSVTITAQLPVGKLLNNADTEVTTVQDFDVFEGERAIGFKLSNATGTAPLTVTALEVADGFAVTGLEEGTSVAAAGEQEFTVAVTQPGNYSEVEAVKITTNAGEFALKVTAVRLADGVFFEDFEDKLDGGFITDGELTPKEERKGSVDLTYNKYFANVSSWDASYKGSLITPAIDFDDETGVDFHFTTYKSVYNLTIEIKVYYSTDRAEWTKFENVTTDLDTYTANTVTLPETGRYYFKFELEAGTAIDNLWGGKRAVVDHDAFIESATGPDAGMVNYPSEYKAVIRNLAAAEDFDVALYVNDEKVAEETVNVDETAEVAFTYIPHAVGDYTVQIKATAGDYTIESTELPLTVTEELVVEGHVVNDGTATNAYVPYYTNYWHSGSRFIYTQEQMAAADIKAGDKLTSIGFKYTANSKNTKHTFGDIQVWLLNSEKETLATTDGIDVTDATKVFDANGASGKIKAALTTSAGVFTLTFDEPFVYDGKTLEVVVASDSTYWTSNYLTFYGTSTSNPAIYYRFDDGTTTAPDYFSSNSYFASTFLPTAIFEVSVDPLTFAGTVTDSESGDAIEGATVSLAHEGKLYSGETDAEGAFSIKVFQGAEGYTLTVEADGYETYTEEDIDLTESIADKAIELTAARGVALAEVLAEGVDGESYAIADELTVAGKTENGNHLYAVTADGDWVRLDVDDETFAAVEAGTKLSGVTGELANRVLAPSLAVTAATIGETGEAVDLREISLDAAFDMPKASELVKVRGYYFDGVLRAYAGASKGQSFALKGDYAGTLNFSEGALYDVIAGIELKREWKDGDGPRRANSADDYDYDFQNLQGQVVSSIAVSPVTGIKSLDAADKAVESIRYYNAAGMESREAFDGINIVVTRYTDGTVTTTKVLK